MKSDRRLSRGFAGSLLSFIEREVRSTQGLSRVLIGVLGGVLLGIGVALLQTVAAERRAREQFEVTTRALALLRRSLLASADAETGQRGFLLTGDPSFLEPYEEGTRIWLPALSELRDVVATDANPGWEAEVAGLERIARAKLRALRHGVEDFRAGGHSALDPEVLAEGKRLMSEYRSAVSVVERRQHAFQRAAINDAHVVERRTVPIIFLLGGSVLALIVVGFRLERRVAMAQAAARETAELREAQTRSELLAQELNHRVKNLFAVVLSIVALSGREDCSAKQMVANIRSRIYALSLAHAVSQGQSTAGYIGLRELLDAVLKPYANERSSINLAGEAVELPVRAVTPFGLLLHELATNAAKYGALSVDGGRIDVRWFISGRPPNEEVVMLWTEDRGPAVASERKVGFGSVLLERAAKQLGGRIEREWRGDGVRATLAFPLEMR